MTGTSGLGSGDLGRAGDSGGSTGLNLWSVSGGLYLTTGIVESLVFFCLSKLAPVCLSESLIKSSFEEQLPINLI